MKKNLLICLFPLLLLSACNVETVNAANNVINYDENDMVLNASDLALEIESTYQLSVNASGLKDKVTWASEDSSVVYVNSSGLVETLKEGSTRVYATYNNLRSYCNIEVYNSYNAPYLEVNYDDVNMYVGDTLEINASLYFKSNLVDDVFITLYSKNDNIVKPYAGTSGGTIKGLSAGSTTVYAGCEYKGVFVNKEIKVNVLEDNIVLLCKNATPSVNCYELEMTVGEDFTPELEVLNNGTEVVDPVLLFSTLDADIVTVANGKLSAVKQGNTEVYVKYGKSHSITFNVTVQ